MPAVNTIDRLDRAPPSPRYLTLLRTLTCPRTAERLHPSVAPEYDTGMERLPADSVFDGLVPAARGTLGLDLLILFGSRARGDARPGADWDFGYLADEAADIPGLLAALVEALEDDRVDLVDLRRASGLLRYRAACDGLLVYEATVDRFDRYRLQAARFWCDNAPVFERGYEEVLGALRP